jgi:His/Glu/Gln/Arg/opine family amino acid ABC transporter permease subunit
MDENSRLFLEGFLTTIVLSAGALLLSLVLGTIVASLRVWGGSVIQAFTRGYVEFFRNTPLLVQLLFLAVLLAPANLNVTREAAVVGLIGLAVYTGAYVTEVVRSGILSVDARQIETARSLGLTQVQALRYVVLPQAVRTVIPPLGNLSIALVKNTAITSQIAVTELLKVAGIIESRTAQFTPYLAALVAYWTLTLPLGWLVGHLERRLAFTR